MKVDILLRQLKEKGGKETPVRRALIQFMLGLSKPACVAGILRQLQKKNLKPNKTTIYRELQFLMEQGLVHELDFGGGRKCYEWVSDHHHHLVCRKCHRIEEVETDRLEKVLASFENKLKSKSKFDGITHTLEFYGVCDQCKS